MESIQFASLDLRRRQREVVDVLKGCPDATFEHFKTVFAGIVEDYSFCLMRQGTPVCYVLLTVEATHAPPEIGRAAQFLGISLPPPVIIGVSEGQRPKILIAALDRIIEVCSDVGVKQLRLNLIGMPNDLREIADWHLRKQRCNRMSLDKLVIDLTQDSERIFGQMTKGHRSDIARWQNKLETEFLGYTDLETCRDLLRTFFKITWLEEFNCYEGLIRTGSGEICVVKREGGVVGGALFATCNRTVEYLIGHRLSSDNIPVHTLILARAISRYKEIGFEEMDLGVVVPGPSQYMNSDSKKVNIARFKRHFGSSLQHFPVFERFFDKDFACCMLTRRMQTYLNSCFEEADNGA